MRNNVAVSPELSGVTYVQGSRGIWGLPHVLQMADSGHLENMKAVVAANEDFLHDGQHVSYGKDYVVNLWVGLTGPAVFAGRLYRYDMMMIPVHVALLRRSYVCMRYYIH